MKLTRFSLVAALTAACLATHAFAADVEPGFKSLFNGRDLSGWEGNMDLWSVQDGAITGITTAGADPNKSTLKHNTFLVYKGGEVADFELRLSYRIVPNNTTGFGNSGIQYRSKVIQQGEMGPIVGGYQADFEAGKTYSGILYEEKGRGILAQRGQKTVIKPGDKKPVVEVAGSVGNSDEIQAAIKAEDWNDYVVIAKGNHLQHFINGRQTIDVTDEDEANAAKSGILALQIHVGGPMTVQFKNVRIKHMKSAKSDLDLMQGEWKLAQVVGNGNAVDEEHLANIRLKIVGNTYELLNNDDGGSGRIELVKGGQLKAMDIFTSKGEEVPAIYEIEGDTMRACYALKNKPRPTDFTSAEDSDRLYVVYKRVGN